MPTLMRGTHEWRVTSPTSYCHLLVVDSMFKVKYSPPLSMDLGCLESLVDMPIKPSHVANPFNLECEGAPHIMYAFLDVCPLLDFIGMTCLLSTWPEHLAAS